MAKKEKFDPGFFKRLGIHLKIKNDIENNIPAEKKMVTNLLTGFGLSNGAWFGARHVNIFKNRPANAALMAAFLGALGHGVGKQIETDWDTEYKKRGVETKTLGLDIKIIDPKKVKPYV